jgi:hypothetical protein
MEILEELVKVGLKHYHTLKPAFVVQKHTIHPLHITMNFMKMLDRQLSRTRTLRRYRKIVPL